MICVTFYKCIRVGFYFLGADGGEHGLSRCFVRSILSSFSVSLLSPLDKHLLMVGLGVDPSESLIMRCVSEIIILSSTRGLYEEGWRLCCFPLARKIERYLHSGLVCVMTEFTLAPQSIRPDLEPQYHTVAIQVPVPITSELLIC